LFPHKQQKEGIESLMAQWTRATLLFSETTDNPISPIIRVTLDREILLNNPARSAGTAPPSTSCNAQIWSLPLIL
jgi:hypothetical protein